MVEGWRHSHLLLSFLPESGQVCGLGVEGSEWRGVRDVEEKCVLYIACPSHHPAPSISFCCALCDGNRTSALENKYTVLIA